MTKFEISFNKTNIIEAGYTTKPHETWGGIDRKWYPKWNGWKIIDQLKSHPNFPNILENNPDLKLLKKSFYRKEFYDKLKLSKFINQDIADEIYDTAVNMGQQESCEYLQRTLNVLFSSNLVVDGIIGNKTINVLNNFSSSEINSKLILKCLNILQGAEYIEICETNPKQKIYLKGWLNKRVNVC